MILSRFNRGVMAHAILLGLCTLAFFWSIQQQYMLVTSYTLVFVWFGIIFNLIWYVKRTNRELALFLEAFRHRDSTIKFRDFKKDPSFKKLHQEFNQIIQDFSQVRSETEAEHLFFQNTIRHVGVGLLAFDAEGQVELYNEALLKLLHIRQLKNIRELDKVKPGLAQTMFGLFSNQQELVKIIINNEIIQLAMRSTEFILRKKKIRLISLQNIKAELEAGELEAWQKLIRVITHEIMNSVGSINILSSSLLNLWEQPEVLEALQKQQAELMQDSLDGLRAIKKRGSGLSRFVETYRSLNRIPEPQFSEFKVSAFLQQIQTLMKKEVEDQGIRFSYALHPADLKLVADEKLLEQVFINLIKNAMEALSGVDDPALFIHAFQEKTQVVFKVEDNGKGIPEDQIENIFVPFFTTRENGSGIGLSISRQIVRLHKGQITVQSKVGKGTVFYLKF
ncbi:MAG: sensor histidine kinase [Candidatus Cyclobacteriaceae bacterium M3_2C_046]